MNINIIYTSITGNNEEIADIVKNELNKKKYHPLVSQIDDIEIEDLKKSDLIFVITYTWDNGTIPDEALDFYDDLDKIDWSKKKVIVIGSGDKFYGADFGKAVDTFNKKFKKIGAKMPVESFKINIEPNKKDTLKIKDTITKLLKN